MARARIPNIGAVRQRLRLPSLNIVTRISFRRQCIIRGVLPRAGLSVTSRSSLTDDVLLLEMMRKPLHLHLRRIEAEQNNPNKSSTTTVVSIESTTTSVTVVQRYDMKTIRTDPDGTPHNVELVTVSN